MQHVIDMNYPHMTKFCFYTHEDTLPHALPVAPATSTTKNGRDLSERVTSTDQCVSMTIHTSQLFRIKSIIIRSQNSHQFFQTGVFCNIYCAFSLFSTLGSHAQWKRIKRWHRDAATERGIPRSVAASLRHWSGDSDSAKKAVKKRIIFSAGQDWHLLVQEKSQQIGGKLWQLDSIMYITHINVRGHKILSMEPFMRLLVCECGYYWRLRVNTCAKVHGAQHPQGK